MKLILPDEQERKEVLRQLLATTHLANSIAPEAWAVTLFEDDRGFRVNVGPVEVLTMMRGTVRILLAANADDTELQRLNCLPVGHKSVSGPKCVFMGSVAEFAAARSLVTPLHEQFVRLAATNPSGNPRRGTPFKAYHSSELMTYASNCIGYIRRHPVDASTPHLFIEGNSYTRQDVFRIIGIDPPTGGPWFTGYTPHGADWFIFCGIGTKGRTGHEYDNHFSGNTLVWYAKGPAKLRQPTIQGLINPVGRVYVFYREADREPFRFAGVGTATEAFDTSPVKVIWRFTSADGGPVSTTLPEELIEHASSMVWEGARKTIEVNVYERDPNARRKCIDHWGTTCNACGFDFEAVYGSLGQGFVHVHHLRPLGEVREGYELDPVADLRPVCPNCHAMLHRRSPALTIDELRMRLANPEEPNFTANFSEPST